MHTSHRMTHIYALEQVHKHSDTHKHTHTQSDTHIHTYKHTRVSFAGFGGS